MALKDWKKGGKNRWVNAQGSVVSISKYNTNWHVFYTSDLKNLPRLALGPKYYDTFPTKSGALKRAKVLMSAN